MQFCTQLPPRHSRYVLRQILILRNAIKPRGLCGRPCSLGASSRRNLSQRLSPSSPPPEAKYLGRDARFVSSPALLRLRSHYGKSNASFERVRVCVSDRDARLHSLSGIRFPEQFCELSSAFFACLLRLGKSASLRALFQTNRGTCTKMRSIYLRV